MDSSLHGETSIEYVHNVNSPGRDDQIEAVTQEDGHRKITGEIYPMSRYIIDGAMIACVLDAIRNIDPDLVGHATLFADRGRKITTIEMSGRIRERLLAACEGMGTETLPQLIMYSGSVMR